MARGSFRRLSVLGKAEAEIPTLGPPSGLFPLFGDDCGAAASSEGGGGEGDTSADLTAPGMWPFDRQCIIRFPEDVARRLIDCLRKEKVVESTSRDTSVGTGGQEVPRPADERLLDLWLRPESQPQQGEPAGRRWHVRAFGEELRGTLVDLPCHLESHVLLQKSPHSDHTLCKSADISRMLVVHRGTEPDEAEKLLDRNTFQWASGLTPATRRIRKRKFRSIPRPDAEYGALRISKAMEAIEARMKNEPYVYEELDEVDEAEYQETLRTQPENVWQPPPIRKHPCPAVAGGGSCEGGAGGAEAGPHVPIVGQRSRLRLKN